MSYTVTVNGAIYPPVADFREAVGTVGAVIAQHARAAAEIGDHADAGLYFEIGAQAVNTWHPEFPDPSGHWRVHGPGHAATWFQITEGDPK